MVLKSPWRFLRGNVMPSTDEAWFKAARAFGKLWGFAACSNLSLSCSDTAAPQDRAEQMTAVESTSLVSEVFYS